MLSSWCLLCVFFFFKQKTAYEMRISDWSSDVCSSDLFFPRLPVMGHHRCKGLARHVERLDAQCGKALAYLWRVQRHRDGLRNTIDGLVIRIFWRQQAIPPGLAVPGHAALRNRLDPDRKSTRLNSSH